MYFLNSADLEAEALPTGSTIVNLAQVSGIGAYMLAGKSRLRFDTTQGSVVWEFKTRAQAQRALETVAELLRQLNKVTLEGPRYQGVEWRIPVTPGPVTYDSNGIADEPSPYTNCDRKA